MANVSDFTIRAPSAAARTPRWIDEASQQLNALSHSEPCTGEAITTGARASTTSSGPSTVRLST